MVVAIDGVALRSSHPGRVDVAARHAKSAVVELEVELARLSAMPCPPVLGRASAGWARVHELANSAGALIAITAWPLTDAYCATALLLVPCPLRVGEEMYRSGRVALAAEKRVAPKLRRGHSSLEQGTPFTPHRLPGFPCLSHLFDREMHVLLCHASLVTDPNPPSPPHDGPRGFCYLKTSKAT